MSVQVTADLLELDEEAEVLRHIVLAGPMYGGVRYEFLDGMIR